MHDLIAFADDLESTYMQNMDISNESIIEDNLPKWLKQTNTLSNNRENVADRKCQAINHYFFREKKGSVNFELLNHMYFKNMNENFVKYYRNYGIDTRCVGFYKNDALDEENRLHNYIFENENI